MTLLENLLVVGKGKEKIIMERAMDLLHLVRLEEKRTDYASDLSFGRQKLLSLAQVLMSIPSSFFLTNLRQGSIPRSRMS